MSGIDDWGSKDDGCAFLIPVSCLLITNSVEKDMFVVLYVP